MQGAVDRYNCIYVKPQTGQSTYKFDIMYDQCGSKPDLNGRFYENNIVIQYDKDLIEVSNVFFLKRHIKIKRVYQTPIWKKNTLALSD